MRLTEILERIGFELSVDGSWHYNFGNGEVKAIQCFNPEFYEGISFFGSWRTDRAAGEILFNLPLEFESYDLGLAYISYHFRRVRFAKVPHWLNDGLALKDLLPWEIEAKAFDNNPVAKIEHEWFSVLVNKLCDLSVTSLDDDLLSVSFRDGILMFECGTVKLVCPASGKDWERAIKVKAKSMEILPKRIYKKQDAFVYAWKEILQIGNRGFNIQ